MSTRAAPFAFVVLLALLALLAPLGLARAAAAPLPQAPPAELAATRTLSDPGPRDGWLRSLRVAGERAVYRADYDAEARFELYSVPLVGGALVRLSAALPPGQVEKFELAGERVVFSYKLDNDVKRALYSVPVAGGALTRLSPEYNGSGLDVRELPFLVAGDRAVYILDQERRGNPQVYSVPVAGGEVTRLSPELPDHGFDPSGARNMHASADGSSVAFLMARSNNNDPRIYASPITGGGATLISGTDAEPASVAVNGYAIAPNGSRVIYRAHVAGNERRIMSAASAGGDLQELSATDADFAIAATSAQVVLRSADGGLSSRPLAGGAPTALAAGVASFTLGPDGDDVYFAPGAGGLRRIPIGGGAPVELLAGLPTNTVWLRFADERVFFVAGPVGGQGVYVATAGAAATRISDDSVTGGGITDLQLSPAGDVVYYTASLASNQSVLLYRVPAAGGASLLLSRPGPALERSIIHGIDGSGAVLFTQATRRGNSFRSQPTLFRAPLYASAALPLDSTRASVGDVQRFAVSPSAGRAIYLADQEVDGRNELYSVPVAGGTPLKLNAADQQVYSFALNPARDRVLFAAGTPGQADWRLRSIAVGGGEATPVGDAPEAGEFLRSYIFTPDGSRVVYWTGVDSSAAGDLYSAPVGGGPAQRLAGGVISFKLDPTGARVLFVDEGAPTGRPERLSSISVAGGAATVLGGIDQPVNFLISPDGSRVLYYGPDFMGSSLRLQPVTGGATTVLADATIGRIDNGTLQFSADGAFLLAAGITGGPSPNDPVALQLRRVPLDGGPAVNLVERSFPAAYRDGGLEIAFAQAPAGGPVVFSISENIPDPNFARHTLASVPLVGGAETLLFGPADLSVVNVPFKLSADGGTVLFVDTGVLKRVPAAGGSAPERLGKLGFFHSFSFADDYGFAPDGAALFVDGPGLYRAAPGVPAMRVDGLPAGSFALLGAQVGSTLVFRGGRDRVPQEETIVYELYAVDLSAVDPRPFRSSLPFLRR